MSAHLVIPLCLLALFVNSCPAQDQPQDLPPRRITLPEPALKSGFSLEEALATRRSVRSFNADSLSLPEVSQLLWSAQGITSSARNLRVAPSAGALFPLTAYVVAVRVTGLVPGAFEYRPWNHSLEPVADGDVFSRIVAASRGQGSVKQAAIVIALAGNAQITRSKYGDRAERYVWLEAGHAAQNVLLQAAALGLGAVPAGSFVDADLAAALRLPAEQAPLYLIPVGRTGSAER